jgi:LysM repeat protein
MMVGASTWGALAEEPLYHTVSWGETLSSIARLYGVTVQAIVDANQLKSPNTIYVGQKLLIPVPAEQYVVHIVAQGESLLSIAAKYGVTVWDIAKRNGLWNINLIYVGQRLLIPGGGTGPTPTPQPTPPQTSEAIIISSPAANSDVRNPITVTGWGSAFENSLAVDVLDASGITIAQGQATVDAEFGQYGPFTGTITLTVAITATQPGRVQVYSISPRDGAIEHLASVTVNLQP